MAKSEQRQTPNQPQAEGRVLVELSLGPARDLPVQWANKVIVNFIGAEFLVSIVAAAPEPWVQMPKVVPKKIEGKVLARYAFSVPEWAAAVKSFSKQIEGLQKEGAFTVEFSEEARE